jgi:ABC-type nitrate/sulfonate/bicarbonate transport system substrate-binding protein
LDLGVKSNSAQPSKRSRSGSGRPVRIGFVPLADVAPLMAADQLGYFEEQGVEVELHREVGWATIREKILYHELDAAHAPAGLVLSLRLGVHGHRCRSLAPFVFNVNGNAITLSRNLYQRGVRDAASLLKLIRSMPQQLFTFGVVALWSSHHILLREWMTVGGINPDKDVRVVMLPPPQMAGSLAAGLLDGYCAGEPWNSAAILSGTGWCPATSETIAPGHPEKVLLTTEDFSEERPDEFKAILRALDQACAFCDESKNRRQLPGILAAAFRSRDDQALLGQSLTGPFDTGLVQVSADRFHVFHRDGINRPSPTQARWLLNGFFKHGILNAEQQTEAQEAMDQCWSSSHYDAALNRHSLSPKTKMKRKSVVVA